MQPIPELVGNAFSLTGSEKGERSVRCPLHEDKSNSASINMDKQVFFCHAGCGGHTFEQLEGGQVVTFSCRIAALIRSKSVYCIPIEMNISQ